MIQPITSIFSRPIEVSLAGRVFLVGEIRLSDVVELQSFLDKRSVSPLEALRPKLRGMEPHERHQALRAVYDVYEAGVPMWGKESGNELFNSGEGIVKIMSVILRRHQPWLTEDEVVEIGSDLSDSPNGRDEYQAMRRAWSRIDPMEELEVLLGIQSDQNGHEIGWPQAIVELAVSTGYTLDYIENLTLSQFKHLRRGGKPPTGGVAVAPKTGKLTQVVAKMKAMMNREG